MADQTIVDRTTIARITVSKAMTNRIMANRDTMSRMTGISTMIWLLMDNGCERPNTDGFGFRTQRQVFSPTPAMATGL